MTRWWRGAISLSALTPGAGLRSAGRTTTSLRRDTSAKGVRETTVALFLPGIPADRTAQHDLGEASGGGMG